MPKLFVYQRAEDLGIPVQDANDRVLVTVTNHDVVNAKKANSKHCALARASLRLPEVNAAYFFRCTAYLEFKDRMVRFELPNSVQKEIVSFDRARMFAPGVYQLTPPSPSRSPADAAKYRKKRKAQIKRAEVVRSRLAKLPADLTAKIAKIAAADPVNASPEQKEFERRINGIVDPNAPLPLKTRKSHHHRTQYVRGMSEP